MIKNGSKIQLNINPVFSFNVSQTQFPDDEDQKNALLQFSPHIINVIDIITRCEESPIKSRLAAETILEEKWIERIHVSISYLLDIMN